MLTHDKDHYHAQTQEAMHNQDEAHPSTVLAPTTVPTAPLALLDAAARTFVAASMAANTQRAYRSGWQHFTAWCADHQLADLPAEPSTVVRYLTMLATATYTVPRTTRTRPYRVATLNLRLAAIKKAHDYAQQPTPTDHVTVRELMRGIRRTLGTAPASKAAAVTDIVRQMVEHLPPTLMGQRDRALILIGFAGAFRRSELVSLDVRDCVFTDDGLQITLRRAKTDQEQAGYLKGIPYGSNPDTCPVRQLRRWLQRAQIVSGPVFRPLVPMKTAVKATRLRDDDVARIIKKLARAANIKDAVVATLSGHSLRAGLVTSAAAANVPEYVIAEQTGHKDMRVLRRYIRRGKLFRDNAAGKVGL